MKKKILIVASAVALVILCAAGIFLAKNRFSLKKHEATSPSKPRDVLAAELEERNELGGDFASKTRAAAAAPATELKSGDKKRFYAEDGRLAEGEPGLGKVFTPKQENLEAGGSAARKLEYNIAVNYQIDTIKSARAFFNQWIPRYGFLLSESAAGSHNGYMTLRVRVRSSNLYAALNDLDSIGALTAENITVLDHTENAVYQQMLGAREEIRKNRRSAAAAATGGNAKNWEATENLLSQSEDKQLATRMEEWRINDRIGWATIQVSLALPVTAVPAPVEVPEFRNAFVGLLNVLLQMIYALIYIVPLLVVGYVVYRGIVRITPALRRLLPG